MSRYDDRLADYVDVKERIRLFFEKYPDGRLVTAEVRFPEPMDDMPRISVKALAYRTPDDPLPASGWSWMAIPGTTPYTRGSEIENTETSAWGRAIGALGIGIDKSIASKDEIDAKSGEEPERRVHDPGEDGSLIGKVEKGKPPVDYELRQTPDGPACGFALVEGRTKLQVLAVGRLADALVTWLPQLTGVRVKVWGSLQMIGWEKDGKKMPAYRRVILERIETPDFTLPATIEAPSEPMFALDAEERAMVGGNL
jgi:hypothetical protein